MQETFARVLRKPRILRSEDDVGYLLRVLRNTFFSTRRTAARRPQTTALPDDLDLVEDRCAIQPETSSNRPSCTRRSPNCPTTSATRWWRSTWSGCPIARRRRRSGCVRRRSPRACTGPASVWRGVADRASEGSRSPAACSTEP